jgi:hypothetical protein
MESLQYISLNLNDIECTAVFNSGHDIHPTKLNIHDCWSKHFTSEGYCGTLGTLRARLRRFRPHMEQRLLQCENRRSHTSSRTTAEIRALILLCWVTRLITPTWHCWIFISFSKLKEHHCVSGEEVAAEVKLCFCHQTAQFYHEGLKVNIWSLVKVCKLQGWICKEITV